MEGSTKGVDRGIPDILKTCCIKPCPTPFQFPQTQFSRGDGSSFSICIINGAGSIKEISKKSSKSNIKNVTSDTNNQTQKEEEESEIPNDQDQNSEQVTSSHSVQSTANENTESSSHDLSSQQTPSSNEKEQNESNSTTDKNDESNDPGEPNEEEDKFDKIITVNEHEIDTDLDEECAQNVINICDHIKSTVGQLYDVVALSGQFKFGIKEDTSTITLIDGTIHTTTNGFTKQLLRNYPNGEEKLNDIIINELSSSQNHNKCPMECSDCSQPRFLIPRIYLILYKAHLYFSKVDEGRLYRLIKNRLQGLNPDTSNEKVTVCMRCYHLLIAEERKKQAAKEENRIPAAIDPYPFSSLTEAELSQKGKAPVGTYPGMYKATCFAINQENSPYTKKMPIIKQPPKPPKYNSKKTNKLEPWVERLSNSGGYHIANVETNNHQIGCVRHSTDSTIKPEKRTKKLPSEIAAQKVYSKPPFDFEFIDRMKANNKAKSKDL